MAITSGMKGHDMRCKALVLVLAAAVMVAGCGGGDDSSKSGKGGTGDQKAGAGKTGTPTTTAPAPATAAVKRADGDVREPAVAGAWYPANSRDLLATVDGYLASTAAGVSGKVRGLIVPHAGYQFSGLTAAVAYKQIMGQSFNTVIVMGPSHTAAYEGVSTDDSGKG